MAAINQIKLNSTSTTYDINDKRISTTAVSTATHFLATDGSVSSIAPITAENAASVLGDIGGITFKDKMGGRAFFISRNTTTGSVGFTFANGQGNAGVLCVDPDGRLLYYNLISGINTFLSN